MISGDACAALLGLFLQDLVHAICPFVLPLAGRKVWFVGIIEDFELKQLKRDASTKERQFQTKFL